MWARAARRCTAALACGFLTACAWAQPPALDEALLARIDAFVEGERQASGLPGIALAIVQLGRATHVRGFGQDGRGQAIRPDTPFPIGSVTKSFTSLLIRQAIDAGQLDADAPVQRYLPWFRVADEQASAQITLRHLLHQTSGFSRADGLAPLVRWSSASVQETARGFATVALNRPVGERFEYSNLNVVLLGAVLEAVTQRSWQVQVQEQVFQALGMRHSYTDHDAGRQAGMTELHRLWFGVPVAYPVRLAPGYAPAGGLVASADDLARYLAMLLAQGEGPAGRVVSPQGVAELLAPGTPLRRFQLGATDFEFRYGQGWFVGPFGAAPDARWHQGALASFEAWAVLLPQTQQAVVLLINAKSDLPFNGLSAVTSRLPIGVVNLLRGQPPPQGPSLRQAYRPLNAACAIALAALIALAVWAARTRRMAGAVMLAGVAVAIAVALRMAGLSARQLMVFAPDAALVLATALVLLCLPLVLRAGTWARRALLGRSPAAP